MARFCSSRQVSRLAAEECQDDDSGSETDQADSLSVCLETCALLQSESDGSGEEAKDDPSSTVPKWLNHFTSGMAYRKAEQRSLSFSVGWGKGYNPEPRSRREKGGLGQVGMHSSKESGGERREIWHDKRGSTR
ncbi:hypothetical protein AK812_SmicGene13676 [Symbiodinium microadriaticum]|uniref:Uncharacterized protein n=1 Tax=Symbiodinium microadriaticum TaxID=2951 RepID=A0A1Q9E7E8_SYMMI|nr:hypothetical protein AK812_SmicGene13676 [Symbiodinium microadriaticum]